MNDPNKEKEAYSEVAAEVGEGIAEISLEGVFDVVIGSVGDIAGEIIGGIADGI